MNQTLLRSTLRGLLVVYHCLLIPLALLPERRVRPPRAKLRILITGTFYTDQWLVTHLRPLAASGRVGKVTMIAGRPVPHIEDVEAIYPPRWASLLLGEVGSRTIVFVVYALVRRYDVIGGFHFLLNGLFAVLLAKIKRRRSLYICGGGPREIEGGGYATENRLFGRLRESDPVIEKLLMSAVRHVDITICMGHRAAHWFRRKGVSGQIEVVPGGFDDREFFPSDFRSKPDFDLILVGRLSEVKRVDLLIDAVAQTAERLPDVTAVIVGDGPDRDKLESYASKMNVAGRITFAGWQQEVADWLRRSRVFVLTSDSEGLSQALVQALMCGLPAVVSDVGDLSDVVHEGANGFLIDERTPDAFARKFVELLADDAHYEGFRRSALESTVRYRIQNVATRWDEILAPPEIHEFESRVNSARRI